MTIAGMILVNSPGSGAAYPWLRHAAWNGWTFADLIFPSFLVIMGVSLAISLSRRLARDEDPWHMRFVILRRSALIFGFGLLISAVVFNTPSLRIPGVLQRIALCYLACAVIFLNYRPRAQAWICGALLLGYWILIAKIPGAGPLTPEGNLASRVDALLLGSHRITPSDPEGILGTIPAVATTLLGVLAGELLRTRKSPSSKGAWLAAAGAACACAGWLWGLIFPINKHLWTSSYALFAGGIALASLGLCYGVVEIRKLTLWGKPFEVFGRNPLISYFLSGLFYGLLDAVPARLPSGAAGNLKLLSCRLLFGGWLSPENASLAWASAYLACCWGLMTVLYKKKIFLKI